MKIKYKTYQGLIMVIPNILMLGFIGVLFAASGVKTNREISGVDRVVIDEDKVHYFTNNNTQRHVIECDEEKTTIFYDKTSINKGKIIQYRHRDNWGTNTLYCDIFIPNPAKPLDR